MEIPISRSIDWGRWGPIPRVSVRRIAVPTLYPCSIWLARLIGEPWSGAAEMHASKVQSHPRRAASIAAMSIFFIASSHRTRAQRQPGRIGDRFRQAIGVICPAHIPFRPRTSRTRSPGRHCRRSRSIAIRFGLVSGCDLEARTLRRAERSAAVEPEARDAHHGELDRQHVPFLP